MFGAQTKGTFFPMYGWSWPCPFRGEEVDGARLVANHHFRLRELPFQEVHRGRSDESRDENIVGES